MLYRILKFLVGIGIAFYYKKIVKRNGHHLSQDGPIIIIANHPNTLMDAWMIGMVSKRPVHFMAKATLFNSKFKLKILKSLNMIPINRANEGKISGVSNQDSFEACYRILEEGKDLMIFPEGSSYQERILRLLKSGTARIAIEAERRNAGMLNLKVVPVGLNYQDAHKFRSSVLIQVGEPIVVADYLTDDEQKKAQNVNKLTEKFRISLESLLVNVKSKTEEKRVEDIAKIIKSKYYTNEYNSLEGEIKLLKTIRDKMDEYAITQAWKLNEIDELTEKIKWKILKLKIKADFLDRKFRSTMFLRQIFFSLIFVLIGLPLFIYGFVHNILQFKLTDKIIPKLTKDIEYYSPLAVLIGLIIYPLFYIGFLNLAQVFFYFTFWEKVAYFSSMPITGFFAYFLHQYFKHIHYKWRYILSMFKNKQALRDLQNDRLQLRSYFDV